MQKKTPSLSKPPEMDSCSCFQNNLLFVIVLAVIFLIVSHRNHWPLQTFIRTSTIIYSWISSRWSTYKDIIDHWTLFLLQNLNCSIPTATTIVVQHKNHWQLSINSRKSHSVLPFVWSWPSVANTEINERYQSMKTRQFKWSFNLPTHSSLKTKLINHYESLRAHFHFWIFSMATTLFVPHTHHWLQPIILSAPYR